MPNMQNARRSWNRGKGAGYAWLQTHLSYDEIECLIWPFTRDSDGYAQLSHMGKRYQAHRLICEWINGPPPTPEHHAAHECGKGLSGCVHPKHVTWKTISENIRDREVHGTAKRGSKLSADQVREIFALKGILSQRQIAAQFGVTRGCIKAILEKRAAGRINVGRNTKLQNRILETLRERGPTSLDQFTIEYGMPPMMRGPFMRAINLLIGRKEVIKSDGRFAVATSIVG